MPPRADPVRQERYALGVAEGLCLRHAATAAGYSRHSNCVYKIARDPAFRARVEALTRQREWGRSNELGAIIALLMDCADKALAQGAVQAARLALAEAAKFKAQLPRPLAPGEPTDEEWRRTWGPAS